MTSQDRAVAQATGDPRWHAFKQEDGLASNDVLSILIDEGAVWFGTGAGISRFNGTWETFETVSVEVAQPTTEESSPIGRVQALARDPNRRTIWAGTSSGILARWDGTAWQQQFAFPTSSAPLGILTLQLIDEELWIGTSQGLYTLDLAATSATPQQVTAIGSVPVYVLADGEAVIWAGTGNGLWRWQEERWLHEQLQAIDSLSNDVDVYALWIDAQQTLWIGTPVGVARITAQSTKGTLIPTANARNEPALVQALDGDASGTVWVGMDGGGAIKLVDYGQATDAFGPSASGDLETTYIRDVAIDQDGAVWFATPVGVFRYQDRTWFNDPDELQQGLPADAHNIRDMLIARDEALWIATGAGVRRKVGRTFINTDAMFTTQNSALPHDSINALVEDNSGSIWAGTFAGVALYQDDSWRVPFDAGQLPSPVVTDLLADAEQIWIGTEQGLAVFDLHAQTLRLLSDTANRSIESLTLDGLGRVWVGIKDEGIWYLNTDQSWTKYPFTELFSASGVTHSSDNLTPSLAPDPAVAGAIWAAIDRAGLFRFDGGQWHNGDPENHLPTDFLWTVSTDGHSRDVWVGNEGGVTRFDGETWGTLKSEDGLRSTAIYAIAHTSEGGLWFGGQNGLSYYQPDETPPWIEIVPPEDGDEAQNANQRAPSIEVGEIVRLHVNAGDLQTAQRDLTYYYRHSWPTQAGPWQEAQVRPIEITFEETGSAQIELRVRDQSFNYSTIAVQPFEVVRPAETIYLFGLGPMNWNVFQTIVALGFVALLGFGYVSLEILQGRRRAREALSRSYNPYVSGEPVRREDMFFGRHDLLQRIIDTLHNNSIMIHGERRIGKTTLLYQLLLRLEEVDDPDYWFVPVYIDLEGTSQSAFFHLLIEEIAGRVTALLTKDDETPAFLNQLIYVTTPHIPYTDRAFHRDLRQILQALQEYGKTYFPAKQLRMILLLDEMDVVSAYDHLTQQQLRRIFMRDFAATVGAVVAGIQISRAWDRVESPWFNMFNEIEVPPFTREQAVELLIEPVRDYYTYDSDALEFIIAQSEGRPFRIQQYGLEAVYHMLQAGRRRIKVQDVLEAHRSIQDSSNNSHSDAGLIRQSFAPKDADLPTNDQG